MKKSFFRILAFVLFGLFVSAQLAMTGCDSAESSTGTEEVVNLTVGESGEFSGLGQSDVDFYLSEGDLMCLMASGSLKVVPGGMIKMQAKVHKNTSAAASGFVIFSIIKCFVFANIIYQLN